MAIYGTGGWASPRRPAGIAIAAAVTPRGARSTSTASTAVLGAEDARRPAARRRDHQRRRRRTCRRLLRWLRDVADDRAARISEVRASTIVEYRTLADNGRRKADLRAGGRHVRVPARPTNTSTPLRTVGHLPAARHRRPPAGHPPRGQRGSAPTPCRRRCWPRSSAGWCCASRSEDDYLVDGRAQGRPGPGLASGPRPAGEPPGAARRARRRLEPGRAGARGAQAQRGRCCARASNGPRRSSGCRTRSISTSCPPQPGSAGDRRRRRDAPARRNPGQGPPALAGPPGSGRTVALVTLAYALRRSNPGVELLYIGSRRPPRRP